MLAGALTPAALATIAPLATAATVHESFSISSGAGMGRGRREHQRYDHRFNAGDVL